MTYLALKRATPEARRRWIEVGYPARDANDLLRGLALNQSTICRALGLSTATLNRKAKAGELLAPDETERLLGIAALIGQVDAIVEESGNPAGFDSARWFSRWLDEPLPALGGARPIAHLSTMENQAQVSRILAQIQSATFA